jgi:ArsR family transcriptional regulator
MFVAIDATDATSTSGDLAWRLKVLGEPTRLQIVRCLAVEDLCTCHLVDELGVAQPLVSHHLRALREAGLVRPEKVGAFTYYALERPVLAEVATLLGDLARSSAGQVGRSRRRPCT